MRRHGLALFVLSMIVHGVSLAASLRYPLLIDDPLNNQLSSLNEDLSKAGSQLQFPDYILLGSPGHDQAHLDRIQRQALHASNVLREDVSPLIGTSLTTYTDDALHHPLCYGGKAADAVELIESLIGTGFSEQTGILAWRHRATIQFMSGYEDLANEANAKFGNVWTQWESNNDSILIIYSDNDSGDIISSALVGRCS